MQPSSPPPANRGNRVPQPQRPGATPAAHSSDATYVPKCYQCGDRGHLKSACPKAKMTAPGPSQRLPSNPFSSPSALVVGQEGTHRSSDNHQLVRVNDQIVTGLRDTGADITLIRSHLVAERDIIPDKRLTLTGVGGTLSHIAQARVEIDWGVGPQEKVVGIWDIPVPVLLGTDLGRLVSYYEPAASQQETPANPQVLCTLGTERERGGDVVVPSTEVLGLNVQPSNPGFSTTELDNDALNICVTNVNDDNDGDDVIPVLAVTRSSTAKRLSSEQAGGAAAPPPCSNPRDSTPQQLVTYTTGQLAETNGFVQALRDDPSLESLRRQASEPLADGASFKVYWEGGKLYSEPIQPTTEETGLDAKWLVVPRAYRGHVLKAAHDIPLAGHLGIHKTFDRIQRHFYWPGVRSDVTNYCRSCAVCQKVKKGRTCRAPLCPLPVIGEPFQRVAVDIIGPLPIPSSSGKKYILTVVDYATRYPEAAALSSLRADKVADALLGIFSRVGFPAEILSDQGPQFMSDLMGALCTKIQMTHIVSSPYHPQTNGLCERFNGTLKQMLSTFVESQGGDWERYLPHLLFAYREVPQESTGFSPFELLYGRNVRGPLKLIRETWEGKGDPTDSSVIDYVLKFRDKMESLMEVVTENMARAQANQKMWYDRNARDRAYEVNDKVYALLPVKHNKLHAAWEGPYTVVKRVTPVTYLVNMGGRRQNSFHVNMLKAHRDRTQYALPVCSQLEPGETDPLLDLLADTRGFEGGVNVNPQLTPSQKAQLQEVLGRHGPTFTSTPGRTNLAVHRVDTGAHPPLRQSAYRISPEIQADMKREIEEMLELGVIQKSCSAWAAPVVLVPKKDKTTRFCVDYRRLNAITTTDAYPMPRIDELLDKLAAASYLTIMDLSRGYWQIPLAPDAREKSAFVTPFGLFEFTVMPFGMKNAPATFQRAVNDLLAGMQDFAVAYLDDIAVFSTTWDEHLNHLSQVLERLSSANLTVKPSKCQVGMTEVQYLGHRVGGNTLRPDIGKVDAILAWPRPITKKQVQAFLGTAGYYRKFVPAYSTLAKPLTDATSKKHPKVVSWTPECEAAFQALKQALVSAPVLQAPDFRRRFLVQTDASDYGLGAVLSQVDEKGGEHPILYLSRKLLPREVAYSTTEKECLAIVWALHKLQSYLYGRSFTIITDHNPLTWLNRAAGTNGKLMRWSLSLQQYDFTIQHKAGSRHQNADGLSRCGEPVQ
ncbi:uncharacterized protein [Hyperolius riggenbachi]|uniref:uncharacterized protein n=1 Tax=Hyperolius riggenbachi TaxID=752182 RepID=UPI0035A263F5